MRIHRKIAPIFALLAATAAVAPTVAQADPLLSGYGGPGLGNQAILGSALLNGAGGAGGGSGSTGGGSGSEGSSASGSVSAPPAGGEGIAAPRGTHASAAEGTSSGVASSGLYPASEAGPAGTLGLSGEDLLFILLALLALAFTGALTRRLATGAPREGTGG